MSNWSQYSREAEVGAGGDVPQIPDDLYDARVCDVSEPETKPDIYKEGEDKTQFFIKWELLSDDLPPDTTVRQYISLPPGYLENGVLGEKANLHKVMTALGFDLSGRFRVEPNKWIDLRARVMTEQVEGKFARVTDVKPPRQKASQKQPVAAGAKPGGTLRQRLTDEEE